LDGEDRQAEEMMEVVYAICFIAAAWFAGLAVAAGGGKRAFPLAGTFAVALMGVVGYNDVWVRMLPPKAAPVMIAILAAASAFAGGRSALSRSLSPWLSLVGLSLRSRSRERVAVSIGADARVSPPGLPVTAPGFGDLSLREVMTPKAMMAGVEAAATAAEAVGVVSSSGYSRLVVYQGDLDHIVGVVHVYALLTCTASSQAVKELARPPLLVPESKKCFGMLEEFLREGEQFAVALDEFGGTAGVVTVEDLLEQLVGEMADEHEREEAPVRKMPDGSYLVPGHIRVEEINEKLGVAVPDGDYETISGFVLDRLGRVPARGEKLTVGDATLEIAVSTARRIVTVKVVTNGAAGAQGPARPGAGTPSTHRGGAE
jgi:Mg2+/Co2+ transporter CorC